MNEIKDYIDILQRKNVDIETLDSWVEEAYEGIEDKENIEEYMAEANRIMRKYAIEEDFDEEEPTEREEIEISFEEEVKDVVSGGDEEQEAKKKELQESIAKYEKLYAKYFEKQRDLKEEDKIRYYSLKAKFAKLRCRYDRLQLKNLEDTVETEDKAETSLKADYQFLAERYNELVGEFNEMSEQYCFLKNKYRKLERRADDDVRSYVFMTLYQRYFESIRLAEDFEYDEVPGTEDAGEDGLGQAEEVQTRIMEAILEDSDKEEEISRYDVEAAGDTVETETAGSSVQEEGLPVEGAEEAGGIPEIGEITQGQKEAAVTEKTEGNAEIGEVTQNPKEAVGSVEIGEIAQEQKETAVTEETEGNVETGDVTQEQKETAVTEETEGNVEIGEVTQNPKEAAVAEEALEDTVAVGDAVLEEESRESRVERINRNIDDAIERINAMNQTPYETSAAHTYVPDAAAAESQPGQNVETVEEKKEDKKEEKPLAKPETASNSYTAPASAVPPVTLRSGTSRAPGTTVYSWEAEPEAYVVEAEPDPYGENPSGITEGTGAQPAVFVQNPAGAAAGTGACPDVYEEKTIGAEEEPAADPGVRPDAYEENLAGTEEGAVADPVARSDAYEENLAGTEEETVAESVTQPSAYDVNPSGARTGAEAIAEPEAHPDTYEKNPVGAEEGAVDGTGAWPSAYDAIPAGAGVENVAGSEIRPDIYEENPVEPIAAAESAEEPIGSPKPADTPPLEEPELQISYEELDSVDLIDGCFWCMKNGYEREALERLVKQMPSYYVESGILYYCENEEEKSSLVEQLQLEYKNTPGAEKYKFDNINDYIMKYRSVNLAGNSVKIRISDTRQPINGYSNVRESEDVSLFFELRRSIQLYDELSSLQGELRSPGADSVGRLAAERDEKVMKYLKDIRDLRNRTEKKEIVSISAEEVYYTRGRIESYNPEKGFGKVISTNGEKAHFMSSKIKDDPDMYREGAQVIYKTGKNENGYFVIEISIAK